MRISDWSSDVCSSDLVVDNLDNEGTAILENAALVDVCRSAEPQPGFKNRDACQARVPRAGSNDLKYPANAEIGILVRVDPQQLYCFDHDLLLQPASGAVGSVLSSRLRLRFSLEPRTDRKSTSLNSSPKCASCMPSLA